MRRAVADEIQAIGALVQRVAWPPWVDPRLSDLICRLRQTIDAQLERDGDELARMATRLGLDFEDLETMAADMEHVQRWVVLLAGSAGPQVRHAEIVAELLMVNLFPDELAYIGLLSRPIGSAERTVARDAVLADGD